MNNKFVRLAPGARDNAGHTATVFHPGGGEYANVASKMFVGDDCSLCTLATWETASKRLQ
jgi:hypothetical protein